jgi:hypothetical protein
VADQFVKVTRKGWLSNIMSSFVGVLVGIVLFALAFPVLWMNEGRTNMATVAQSSVALDGASLSDWAEGKQVAVSGTLASNETLGDAPYLRAGAYVQLHRNVEMYAWVENKSTETQKEIGGSSTTKTTYTYEKRWTASPEDSSSFEYPQGHTNPAMAIKSKTAVVTSARVGAYTINPAEIEMPSETEIGLSSANVVEDDRYRLAGDYLFTGKGSVDTPQLGDLRISYSGVPANTPAIVFGKQQGGALVPFVTRKNDRLYRMFLNTDRAGAIKQMNTEYQIMGWILRLVGFLMMWIGLSLCLGPISTLLDVLPFLGSASRFVVGLATLVVALVLSTITILVAVLAHNLVALIVVLALLIGGVMLWSRVRRQTVAAA